MVGALLERAARAVGLAEQAPEFKLAGAPAVPVADNCHRTTLTLKPAADAEFLNGLLADAGRVVREAEEEARRAAESGPEQEQARAAQARLDGHRREQRAAARRLDELRAEIPAAVEAGRDPAPLHDEADRLDKELRRGADAEAVLVRLAAEAKTAAERVIRDAEAEARHRRVQEGKRRMEEALKQLPATVGPLLAEYFAAWALVRLAGQ